MNKYCVFLFFFFASWSGYSQQKDTLRVNPVSSTQQETDEIKLNREVQEDIRNGTLIGPPPERSRQNRFFENDIQEGIAKVDEGHDMMNQDSLPALQVSDRFVKELKAVSKIYHKKTTVNDSQTLANPHISLSFDDILCYLFRPDLRAKMKNKKRLNAYKTY